MVISLAPEKVQQKLTPQASSKTGLDTGPRDANGITGRAGAGMFRKESEKKDKHFEYIPDRTVKVGFHMEPSRDPVSIPLRPVVPY